MRYPSLLAAACVMAVAACDVQDPTQPLDVPTSAVEARSQRASCHAGMLAPTTAGAVTADDCLFESGSVTRHEDLFLVNQRRLGMSDLSGATMLTFSATAGFDAIFGVGGFDPREVFPTPVYGNASFPAGSASGWGNSFSLVSSETMLKAWIAGQTAADVGAYTLSTSMAPSIDTCENGHWVFIQGDVAFSSAISDATACEGTVQFGPYIGAPLNFQFWYVKLRAGETLHATLTGSDFDPSIVLAAIDFGTSQSALDFSAGPGDDDRAVSFTATREFYLYLEASSAPGVEAAYTLTVDSP